MASCHVGTLMAESFCERVLSCANLVVTDGNTLLDDPEVTMLTILRMSRSFMEYMRANHNAESRQAFTKTQDHRQGGGVVAPASVGHACPRTD